MFTIAREWGLRDNANPCFRVRRNKEIPRDDYAGEIVWKDARENAAIRAATEGDPALADSIRQFQFKDTRPKAASEITDIAGASLLLGHSKQEITKRVYRRVGAIAKPSKLNSFGTPPPKVSELLTFLRPIKNPVDQGLRGFRIWRPKPESNRRGRICKPGLKSLITAVCRLFGVPLLANLLCLTGRILSRLGLRLWTQKSSI